MSAVNVEIVVEGRIATIWLNRPEVRNAFDGPLVENLTQALKRLSADNGIQIVVLGGRGQSFCAGVDLEWMARMAQADADSNLRDAMATAEMFQALYACSKPVIARIQGAVFGGGLGLVAASDIAIATTTAVFAASEVRLGLIPAVISPYVMRAMGRRASARYFLTGERFDAAAACSSGLVHEVCEPALLDETTARVAHELLQGAPQAQGEIKSLIREMDVITSGETARHLARVRAGAEAREGIDAFLEKRTARWRE